MRDFSADHSAIALNTATLGHMMDGRGAGWSPEQVVDACADRGFGGIVFWRREIGTRGCEIGARVRAAGMKVQGLCRAPFLVGALAPPTREKVWMISTLQSTWPRNWAQGRSRWSQAA